MTEPRQPGHTRRPDAASSRLARHPRHGARCAGRRDKRARRARPRPHQGPDHHADAGGYAAAAASCSRVAAGQRPRSRRSTSSSTASCRSTAGCATSARRGRPARTARPTTTATLATTTRSASGWTRCTPRSVRSCAGSARWTPRSPATVRACRRRSTSSTTASTSWLASPLMDSYHTVWMHLHQQLILMLGLTRAEDEAREERLVSGQAG